MDHKENNILYQNNSMDELLDQIGNDAQFNSIHFPNRGMGLDYPMNSNYPLHRQNVYYNEQIPSNETRSTLPFMFNTREDVVPTMVDVGGGNFMVFDTLTAERNANVPNFQFTNNSNPNLSSLSTYAHDHCADYNLFSSGMNSVGVQFNSQPEAGSATPHLLESLVGQLGSDKSGTYSPFGSSLGKVEHGYDRPPVKTRMVAEVRPMRPSYSDVLTKSVPCQKQGKASEGKTRHPESKNGRFGKSTVGRSHSGNSNFNRFNLSVGDEPASSGSNSSLKTSEMKSQNDVEQDELLPKKWVSLDDLSVGMDDDHNFSSETKVKKMNAKHLKQLNKLKEMWNNNNMNGEKVTSTKNLGTKKHVSPKSQINQRDKDSSIGMKVEPTKTKLSEERKGSNQGKSGDTTKPNRRNGRTMPGEKGKKTGRSKRRETDAVWPALLIHRFDFLVAYVVQAARWFINLVLDVFELSTNLALYMCTAVWSSSVSSVRENYDVVCCWFRELSLSRYLSTSRFWPFRRQDDGGGGQTNDSDSDSDSGDGVGKKNKRRLPDSLKHNLPLPSTGEEAMKRLLGCKGKDPYSILGVSQDCTDDDIKKYYKRQAFLVHPDKNNQPGAEEAFKILVHAFCIIGEPEHRKSYDRSVEKTAQAQQAWSQISELLAQLHKKMEYVANTIRCTNCGKRHKRTLVNRPIYAARMCSQCKIHHSVREGEIWAETRVFGLRWRYYACMESAVYDISEWAACQGSNLKNLKANTHQVQYRIVLEKHAQKNRSQQSPSTSFNEPDFQEFINNLYSKPENGGGMEGEQEAAGRNRKHKRKK